MSQRETGRRSGGDTFSEDVVLDCLEANGKSMWRGVGLGTNVTGAARPPSSAQAL